MKVRFETWGNNSNVKLPAYAVMSEDTLSKIDAVGRAIERSSGLRVVTCSSQGAQLENRVPVRQDYELTLGRPLRTGGFSVEARLFVGVLCF